MLLPAMYHWSPSDRRDLIRRQGLLPGSESVTSSSPMEYVCVSPTPSSAWGLSGDMGWTTEVEAWDLWMVRLVEGDEVHVRPDFGPVLREVRVFGAIPPDRCWYVATRAGS